MLQVVVVLVVVVIIIIMLLLVVEVQLLYALLCKGFRHSKKCTQIL